MEPIRIWIYNKKREDEELEIGIGYLVLQYLAFLLTFFISY